MRDEQKGSLRYCDGFTVIEVLIAITLLAVALIPLASILSMSLKASVNNRTSMHAREVAASELDDVKAMEFGNIGISGATRVFAVAGHNQQVAPDHGYDGIDAGPVTVSSQSGDTYTVTRDVRKVINTSSGNSAETKKVMITVSWTGPGSSGSVMIPTYIGPTGNAG